MDNFCYKSHRMNCKVSYICLSDGLRRTFTFGRVIPNYLELHNFAFAELLTAA